MLAALALLCGLLVQPAAALRDVLADERLEVDADEPALGRAIVRSASSQFPGMVQLLPRPAPPPGPHALRLTARRRGGQLKLELAAGPRMRVEARLAIGGRSDSFDIAETAAIALQDLWARLEDLRSHGGSGEPPRPRLRVLRDRRTDKAPIPPLRGPPPEEPEVVAAAPAPALPPPPVKRAPPPLPPPPSRTSPWLLGFGLPLTAAGLLIGAVGVTSLAVDGRCADPSCETRYVGRTAGAGELGVGAAVALTGVSLAAVGLYQRGREQRAAEARPTALLYPMAGPGRLGLVLSVIY